MLLRKQRQKEAEIIRSELEQALQLHITRKQDAQLHADIVKLATWQSNRLLETYSDLIALPRYQPAMAFFKDDLYGPKDYSKRDSDVKRVYPVMVKIVPMQFLRILTRVARINHLAMELDEALLQELRKLGALDKITKETYAEAYRRCNNYELRKKQIELIVNIGEDLDRVARKSYIATALKLAHKPAHMMGLGVLQDFLERGYRAFLQMNGADEFLFQLQDRETKILENIYSAQQDPFTIQRASIHKITSSDTSDHPG